VLGPTASGKTVLSLVLARRFQGEIVNCDSVAMVRELDIGTAKPSAAERVLVPHHLFDCVEPADYVTAGEYARRARAVLREIRERGRLPVVAGGTGLYLRALLEGLSPGPQRQEQLRERLRECATRQGQGYLHRVLRRLDSCAAEKIHPHDTPKLIRAIEVCLGARRSITEVWKQGRDPLLGVRVLRLGLDPDRAALYERINRRARRMFEEGLVEETERLVAKYGHALKPLGSLGYRQAVQVLKGELNYEAAVSAAQQGHRNYAKRQMTWFRREPAVEWLSGFGDDPHVQQKAIGCVEAAMVWTSDD